MTSINDPPVEAKVQSEVEVEAVIANLEDGSSYTTLSAVEGSDEEWSAEGIIAEGKVNGETRYLVEWTGFPIKDATWEPRDHVEGVLLDQWAEQKRLQKHGKAQKFDLSRWTAGWVQELQAKYEKHERRNQARVRLGKPPSQWHTSLEDNIKQTSEYYPNAESRDDDSSSDEDVQWDKLDKPSSKAPARQSKSPASRLQSPETPQPSTAQPAQPRQTKGSANVGGLRPTATEPPKAAAATTKATTPKQARPSYDTPALNSKASTSAQPLRANGVRQMLAGSRPIKSIKSKATAVKSGAAKLPSIGTSAKTSASAVKSNVFIEGKKRKARPNLYTASSDPARNPQLLNHRHVRKLELQRRDKENAAPPQMPKTLFSLDPKQRQAGATEGVNTLESLAAKTTLPMRTTDTATVTRDDAMPKLKRKKTVTFDEKKNSYHESMESYEDMRAAPELMALDHEEWTTSRESGLFFHEKDDGHPVSIVHARPPTPPRSSGKLVSLPDLPPTQVASQDVAKTCLLGRQGRSINLVFKMPPDLSHPWLSAFKSCDQVIFSHLCAAHDFLKMWAVGGHVRQYDLTSGYVSCPTQSIEHVVDRLKLNAQGILSYTEGYNILCFPSRCGEWDSITTSGTYVDALPLRFIMFVPAANLSGFFAPNPQKTIDKESYDGHGDNLITRGLTKFLTLNYAKLIPSAMQNSKEHRFFLAFPVTGSYAEEMRFVAQWLRSSSTATCSVYSGERPGAWREFVDRGLAENGGVVILHEDAMWQVRLFPKMFRVLDSGKFPIYAFTRGLEEDRLFPSSYAIQARPALLNFDQVFWPGTKAFFLTPSFILSRPCQAAVFTRWFRNKYAMQDDEMGGPGRLVVCADFADWLLDLVIEQSSNRSRKPRRDEIEGWTQLWGDISELETRSDFLIVAPRGLDGNDEQSLVNWFGMWSLRHMDGVCLCYVIGSSYSYREDVTRSLEAPPFVEGTVSCPIKAEDESDGIEAVRQLGNEPAAPLRLIKNDSHEEIASHLGRYDFQRVKTLPFSVVSIFNRPVSYWNLDIGPALGDRDLKFSTFMDWYRFVNFDLKSRFNTYGALFYTIQTGWDGQPLSLEQTKRRPWVALIRPRNPHRKPWEMLELLIWDPSYRTQFSGRSELLEVELIEAQKHLMKVMSEKCSLPLSAVRVSWNHSMIPDGQALHPMDQCLIMLEMCATKTLEMLPAPQHVLEAKGWVLVKPFEPGQVRPQDQGGPAQGSAGTVASPEPMDIDSGPRRSDQRDSEDSIENMRVVFHPPRSPMRQPGRSRTSICTNRFVKHFHETVSRGSGDIERYAGGGTVNYKFASTMSWYKKQIQEGRDFKHMMVAPFEDVFQRLGISES